MCIFAYHILTSKTMETITLTYDSTSSKAMQLLKELLATGFFKEKKVEHTKELSEENKLFVENSRQKAALIFSKKI